MTGAAEVLDAGDGGVGEAGGGPGGVVVVEERDEELVVEAKERGDAAKERRGDGDAVLDV